VAFIRWPHAIEWTIANNTDVWGFSWTVAQRAVFPRTSERTHGDSVPTTKTLEVALPVIGYTAFGIADGIMELSDRRRRIDWVRIEDRCVENIIQTNRLGRR
jgi:hypothetical protein